jgi:hypothetical protein
MGRSFEEAVIEALGASKNKATILGSKALVKTIPDVLFGGVMIEIKGVKYLTLGGQLVAQGEAAKAGQILYVIVVKMESKVSGPVQKMVESTGGFIVRFDAATGKFHPF